MFMTPNSNIEINIPKSKLLAQIMSIIQVKVLRTQQRPSSGIGLVGRHNVLRIYIDAAHLVISIVAVFVPIAPTRTLQAFPVVALKLVVQTS